MALLRGFLYVIADQARQFAKVGMSRDVNSRLKQLQTDCPLRLEIVQAHPCTYVKVRETRAHILLKELRVQGEWFKWDEGKIQTAVDDALAIPDETIKFALSKYAGTAREYRKTIGLSLPGPQDYPVKRLDTGEIFPSSKVAAQAVLDSGVLLAPLPNVRELARVVRLAIKEQFQCAGCKWARA
jgi:hypothetical protein